MIPEAAAEAAARYCREGVGVTPTDAWIRGILEAAAPHMGKADGGELRKLLDSGTPHHRSANDAELDALVEAIIADGWRR